MSETVEITINYKGNDISLFVDINTANILMNDPTKAKQYVENLLSPVSPVPTDEADADSEVEGFSNENSPPSQAMWNKVWQSKKPTNFDHEATVTLLALREKYADKFSDRKSKKRVLWSLIGQEMKDMGFFIGSNNDEIIERLRQKFSNLQKQYFNFIKHVNSTGEKKRDPPLYFDELHGILGNKDKTNPSNVQDSMGHMTTEEEISEKRQSENMDAEVMPHDIKTRFQRKNIRPMSSNQALLEEIKKEHRENMDEKKRQFAVLEEQFKIQNEQRSRMIENFEKLIEVETRKRKYNYSSSDDE